jgi:zinc-ribbon domain
MASTPAFCSACGASLLPGARFCTRCGRPVQAEEPMAPVQAAEITAPVQAAEITAPVLAAEITAPVLAEGMTAPVQAEETMAGEVVGVPPPPSGTIVVEGPPPPMAPAATLQPAAVLPSTYPSVAPPDYPSVAPPAYPSVAPPAYPSVAPPAYPSVAPPAYPSVAPPAYPRMAPVAVMPARKGMGTGARIAIALAITVVALGGATILLIRIISSPTNTISYAVEFDNDYLAMLTADNAGVVQENSTTLATSVAGLKARIAARKTFDGQVARISFPASASADVKQLETTDAAVEQILAKLLADEGNVKAYNADLAAEQPLRAAFDAAVTKLLKD